MDARVAAQDGFARRQRPRSCRAEWPARSHHLDFWVHPKDFQPNDRAHARIAEFLEERIAW